MRAKPRFRRVVFEQTPGVNFLCCSIVSCGVREISAFVGGVSGHRIRGETADVGDDVRQVDDDGIVGGAEVALDASVADNSGDCATDIAACGTDALQ